MARYTVENVVKRGLRVNVFLDGVPVRHCIEADDELGFVVVFDKSVYRKKLLTGHVVVTMGGNLPARLKEGDAVAAGPLQMLSREERHYSLQEGKLLVTAWAEKDGKCRTVAFALSDPSDPRVSADDLENAIFEEFKLPTV